MQRRCGLKRRTPLNAKGTSDTAVLKDRIQQLVREIVIKRDGGCIFRNIDWDNPLPICNGYAKDGHLIHQADHLLTRANSATYADTRLIVCVCKGHHGWKKWNERRYNEIVRTLIGPDRSKLWDACRAARYRPVRTSAYDWKLAEAALRMELSKLKESRR